MNTFWAVFFAILAAALVIGLLAGIESSYDSFTAQEAERAAIKRMMYQTYPTPAPEIRRARPVTR